jgi:hypothetical protein
MKYARHPEFPQFRSKLAAMKKVRRQVAAHRSLHSLEKTMARFLPAGLLEGLVAVGGPDLRAGSLPARLPRSADARGGWNHRANAERLLAADRVSFLLSCFTRRGLREMGYKNGATEREESGQ